jgi:hypothetical protein
LRRYDEGGLTGRETLDAAVAGAAAVLARGGRMVIGQFSFLGTHERYGVPPSTFEVLARHGLDPRILASYEVPLVPIVARCRRRIEALYPRYAFAVRGRRRFHQFAVIEGRKRG